MLERFIGFLQRRTTLMILFTAVVVSGHTTVYAQGSGRETTGNGGSHIIIGKIFFPSGRRAEGTIQVKLKSFTSRDITVLADSGGSFTFTNIAPDNYTIEVDAGKEFEVAQERLTVDADLTPPRTSNSEPIITSVPTQRRFTVMITLQPKREGARTKPGVVNAALADVPEDARALYEKALALAQNNDSAKAIDSLKSALSIFPNFPLALNELGVQYLKLGAANRAVEPLRAATKLRPDAFLPRLNLGIALLETHQFAGADAELREALKLSSTPLAHMYLGLALIGSKRYEEAQNELETAVSKGGENLVEAHRYLGGLYWRLAGESGQKSDYARAITEFETYLRLAPNATDAERIRETIKKDLRPKS
jgi:tetratricopeptide (TPR) repeat protein